MDGIKYIVGPAPSEMTKEERLVFASKEIERTGTALQAFKEKEQAKKQKKEKKKTKGDLQVLLKALEMAGVSPEDFVKIMKEDD